MKKLIILFALAIVAVAANAQRTVAVDTLQGAETVSFAVMPGAKAVTAVCTQLGGTSDGTLALYGSTDNVNFVFINFLSHTLGVASPKASVTGDDLNQITITDGLVANWITLDKEFDFYKLVGVGTAGDTTKIDINYSR